MFKEITFTEETSESEEKEKLLKFIMQLKGAHDDLKKKYPDQVFEDWTVDFDAIKQERKKRYAKGKRNS